MKFLKKIAASICAAVCASTAVSALPVSAAEVLKYEAENASLSGVSAYSGSGFSGGGYVRFTSSGSCTFNIYVPKSGIYSFNFVSEGIGSDKVNNASLDGESIGSFTSKADSLDNAEIYSVYVSEGDHQVTVTPSWGWIDLDCLIVQEEVVKDFYNVSKDPVNPNASESAKRLMSYLADIFCLHYCVCVYVHDAHSCHIMCVEVKGQLAGVGAPLPPHGSWGFNPGHYV